MTDNNHNPHIYTDGSSENAVIKRGGSFLVHYSDEKEIHSAFPTGKISSNFRAKSTAFLKPLRYFTEEGTQRSTKIAFFTNCKALLKALNNTKIDQILWKINKRH